MGRGSGGSGRAEQKEENEAESNEKRYEASNAVDDTFGIFG